MNPLDRVRLRHIADALNSAINFIRGRERVDLDSDEMLLFAVVRAIEIAGEAASKVTPETRSKLTDLPWDSMIGMRNRVVHAISTSIATFCGPRSAKRPLHWRSAKARCSQKSELFGAGSMTVGNQAITFPSRNSAKVARS